MYACPRIFPNTTNHVSCISLIIYKERHIKTDNSIRLLPQIVPTLFQRGSYFAQVPHITYERNKNKDSELS